MNKNNIIGFTLMALVLIGFSIYNQPSDAEIAEMRKQDSLANAANIANEKAIEAQKQAAEAQKAQALTEAQNDTTALFHKALSGTADSIVLKNSHLELTLSTKGGVVKKAKVLNFKDLDGSESVTLFDGDDQDMNFMLAGKTTNIVTSDLYFTPSNISDSTVTMTALAGNGGQVVFNYVLGKDYMLHMEFKTTGLSGLFAPNYKEVDIEWRDKCRQHEKGFTFENQYSTLTYKESTDDDSDYLSQASAEENEIMEEPLDWVAFKNQFFSTILISKDNFAANASLTSIPQEKGTGYLKYYEAKLKTKFDPTGAQPTELEMYFGPNDYRLLQRVQEQSTFGKELEMQNLVDLGWPLVRLINRWFTLYVFDWLTGFGLNMGIVLIIITLLLKAITFPLVKKSYMSSAKMRVLRPKIEEATKQYNKPEDQMMGQQAEQMKMMQWMMYLMPVMFFFMFNDYSAGLNFYYFISLFFSAAIMWMLRKTTNDAKLLEYLEERYKKNLNNPKKQSGFAARLAAMQQHAEELRKQRERYNK